MSSSRKANRAKSSVEKMDVSAGNVFADLQLPLAREQLAKAKLAHQICVLIEDQGMTQAQVTKRLGIDQPKVSKLVRGRLSEFSTDRLLRFLNDLGQDVDIIVRPSLHRHPQGELRILLSA